MRSSEYIHPSLVKYAGSEATIVGLPSHPITWYTVKFHDGKEVKLRSSSFDIIGYEAKHSTQQQFKAALAKQQQQMEQLRAVQQQQHQQHQQQAMMAASHSAMTSASSSSAASSVPSPVPRQLLNHGQQMSHAAHSVTPSQHVHSVHHSPHPLNTAAMLPPMSAQAAAASMQHQQQQQHAAQQEQSHKAQQVKQAIKKESKADMMNGAVQAVTAAAVPAHAMNGTSNSQLTLNVPHHMNGSSSASASSAASASSQHSQQPKMAATVNPMAMNPLFSALSSLQSGFNPSPAAAAAMPFLSPFALQSFFAQATPYDAAIMAAALRANGFPIPMSTMSGLAAMQQMAVQAQAQAASQQQQQHQQQQHQAVGVPHLTIPHQPQGQQQIGNGNGNSHVSHNNTNHSNSHTNQQPTQAITSNHNNPATASPPHYNNTKHGRPNSGASVNGHGSQSLHVASSANTQPSITITPTASGIGNHQLGSFSIHSALPSPLASPLHLNTADILPSPRLPMPDLFFSPPPTSTSLSHSLSAHNHFSLPSSFLHPFSNPPSALTSPTAHTPIVPFDGVIGDISSPHGTMLTAAPHTSTHHAGLSHNKRGHDDLLSVPHGHNGGRMASAVDGMGLGLGMGLGMGVGVGSGYDNVEMLLPLFTPTNASFERLLADADNKVDNNNNNTNKRIRID